MSSDISTPAVFAGNASARTKPTYRFINTADVLQALLEAGFQPSAAQQTRTRSGSDPTYARHMIRLRRTRESLTLVDCIPEICLINAHDGTSAYQLLAGLYRPLCTNGLLCRMGDFAVIRIAAPIDGRRRCRRRRTADHRAVRADRNAGHGHGRADPER